MRKFKIWDLDGTVIDSSHRYATLENGDIDLPRWIENNTRENIALDKLLPLADTMRENFRSGDTVIICTARVLGFWDRVFLADNGIECHYILSRKLGDSRGDAVMKRAMLLELFQTLNIPLARWTRNATFYDDNIGVLAMARNLNIRAKNATILNNLRGAI